MNYTPLQGKSIVKSEKLKAISLPQIPMLSLDISDETLDELIDDLSKKDTRYHVLLGSVKGKEEYEEKIKLKEKRLNPKGK